MGPFSPILSLGLAPDGMAGGIELKVAIALS